MAEIFYVGIDLGTSRTSIASSTGKRITRRSCVGYAKDIVAQKRLGKSYLLGDDAIENRLALDMVWPMGAGVIDENVPRSIEAINLILKNIVGMAVQGKKEKDEIYAAIGVPAQASINNKKAIIDATKDFIGKILIVSEPFSVAYSLDMLDEGLIIDIGGGTTDLCCIHGTIPEDEDQLTLDTAGNFLDQVLTDLILQKYPNVQLTPKIVRGIKEKYGYVSEKSDEVIVTLNEAGKPGQYDLTKIMKTACLELVKPMCQAVQKLVADFDPDFQEKLRNNIIIAGGGSRLRGIDRAVEDTLKDYGGGNAICVQDAEFCGAVGALRLSMEMPEQYWEKI